MCTTDGLTSAATRIKACSTSMAEARTGLSIERFDESVAACCFSAADAMGAVHPQMTSKAQSEHTWRNDEPILVETDIV